MVKIVCCIDLNYDKINFGVSRIVKESLFPIVFLSKDLPENTRGLSFVDSLVCSFIKQEIVNIENKYNLSIDVLYFCVNSNNFYLKDGTSTLIVNPRFPLNLNKRKIKKAAQQAKLLNLDWDKEVIFSCPREFFVDGRKFSEIPDNVYGKRLDLALNFFVLDDFFSDNASNFSDNLNLGIEKFILSPIAEISSFVSSRLKGRFLFFNIKYNSVEIALFDNFNLRDFVSFDQGISNIEKEISLRFLLPQDLISQFLDSYGSLSNIIADEGKEILFKIEQEYKRILVNDFLKVLKRSVGDLLTKAKNSLKDRMLNDLDFILFAGDLSRVSGFSEFAADFFKVKSLLAKDVEKNLGAVVEDSLLGVYGSFFLNKSYFNRDLFTEKPRTFLEKVKYIYEEYF